MDAGEWFGLAGLVFGGGALVGVVRTLLRAAQWQIQVNDERATNNDRLEAIKSVVEANRAREEQRHQELDAKLSTRLGAIEARQQKAGEMIAGMARDVSWLAQDRRRNGA